MSDPESVERETSTNDGIEVSNADNKMMMTRRGALRAGAVGAATLATAGVGSAQSTEEIDPSAIAWDSDLVQDPYVRGTVTVAEHGPDYSELDFTADDGSITSLTEFGIVLARDPDSDSELHNPVTFSPADLSASDLTSFPRELKYDSDSDGDIDEDDDPVSWTDSSMWSKDASGSAGSGTLSDADGDALTFSTSGQTSGDVVTWSFDLSSVGSEDATITSGIPRKFLQLIRDIDTLESGVSVEYALVDSTGAEVVARDDPSGDTATDPVLAAATGNAIVSQPRVGELESSQSADLSDIQTIEIRIKEANASVTIHGFNAQREQEWTFGTYETTDSDGNVVTETYTNPSGSVSITSLSTLPDVFSGATIEGVTYDVEMRASELPSDQVYAQRSDTPDTYAQPNEIEIVSEFVAPVAYDLTDVTFEDLVDETELAQSRYLEQSVATGINEIEDWEDIEDTITWTGRTSRYGSVGETVTLLSTLASSDRTATRSRVALSDDELETATSGSESSGGSGVVVVSGSGGINFNALLTLIMGSIGGAALLFRSKVASLFGR
jgi:hypothetical protein